MAFVRFTEAGRSFSPKATVSSYGMIGFNDGARKRFRLDEYKSAVLYYDADNRRIGVELTNDEHAQGARKIRFRVTGADIAAKSFVDFFGIAVPETTVYPLAKDQDSGFLVIDLAQGIARGKGTKGRGKIHGG